MPLSVIKLDEKGIIMSIKTLQLEGGLDICTAQSNRFIVLTEQTLIPNMLQHIALILRPFQMKTR